MGTLNPELIDALNMLLEDERASVEIEVALSNGATEYLEREALTAMGVDDTLISFLLRDWLESLELPVTRRINGIVLQALDLTRYDDRLLFFLQHQMASRDHAEQILAETDLGGDGGAILRSLADAHMRHVVWCEERAREFAETRQWDFRRAAGRSANGASAESDLLPETSGERSSPSAAVRVRPPDGFDGEDGDNSDNSDNSDNEDDGEPDPEVSPS